MLLQCTADDGTPVTLNIPDTMPTMERADRLQELWDRHVQILEGHWKGPVRAVVNETEAEDVADAMGFMGAIVDSRKPLPGGMTELSSQGYWAHGF